MSLIKLIDFPSLGDERGGLVALESNKTYHLILNECITFFGTEQDVARGFHAHKQLKQVAVCITGKCRMFLDDGNTKESVWLDSATKGVLIEDMVWREMHDFSDDCVLLVLASEHYDESDYIRNYDEFIETVKNDS